MGSQSPSSCVYLLWNYDYYDYDFFFLNIQGDPGKAGEAGSPGASGQRVSAIIVMATLKHTVIFHNKLL